MCIRDRLLPGHDQVVAFTRRLESDELLVLANLSSDEATATLGADWSATAELILGNLPGDSPTLGPEQRLAPWQALVYLRRT